jgi:MerR HTH family regulatory protein
MPTFVTYDSSEVSKLVGIGSLLLNKFVERGSYGIQPSIRPGKGRGGRRLFSPDDVLGIALVWWLFESGLRSGVIQEVLNGICAPSKGAANEAAKKLMKRNTLTLKLRFTPRRTHPGLKVPRLLVQLITEDKLNVATGSAVDMGIHVGILFGNLIEEMKKLTGLPEGA